MGWRRAARRSGVIRAAADRIRNCRRENIDFIDVIFGIFDSVPGGMWAKRALMKWILNPALVMAGVMLAACRGGVGPHGGAPGLGWMELPPGSLVKCPARKGGVMPVVAEHEGSGSGGAAVGQLRPGDVVAFHMTRGEARRALIAGRVQKIPYGLFRFGHVAVVVADPAGSGGLRLLQIAMKQPVNADEGMDYLSDKRWRAYRPERVDERRLDEFTREVVKRASDPRRAYDYPGALGWRNAPWEPEEIDEVGERYSCATLVVAALHYAGYELDAVNRGGRIDIVTPGQVVGSRGLWREPPAAGGRR